jgi:hypothetical protein
MTGPRISLPGLTPHLNPELIRSGPRGEQAGGFGRRYRLGGGALHNSPRVELGGPDQLQTISDGRTKLKHGWAKRRAGAALERVKGF